MNAFLAALINGIILSGAAVGVLWVILRLTPRRMLNAASRYVAWCAALVVTAAAPLLFLARVPKPAPAPAPAQANAVAASPQTIGVGPSAEIIHPPPNMTPTGKVVERQARPASISHSQPKHPKRAVPSPFPIRIPAGAWTRWLAVGWFLASAAMLLRLALSWRSLYRLARRARPVSGPLAALPELWLARCGSRRRGVKLALADEIASPAAIGPFCSSILLPPRLFGEMSESALEQVGLHEAAHLARRDDWALFAQRFIEALLAAHPVVRWVGGRIDFERELACDDFVLAATGESRGYASCLTRVAELSLGRRNPPAIAAALGRSELAHRIEALLDSTRHTGTRLLRARLAAVLTVLAILGFWGGRSPGVLAFATPSAMPAAFQRPVNFVRQAASASGIASAVAGTRDLALRLASVPALAGQVLAQTQIISIESSPSANAPAQAPSPPVRPEDLCLLAGKVANAVTGEPIAGATIYINGNSPANSKRYQTTTDQGGRFEAKGVDPGSYKVSASQSRFVNSSYWDRAAQNVTLAPRQKAEGIDLTLIPGGAIRGRVVNAGGEPMAGYYVTPLVYKYVGGERVFVEAQGSPVSNDAGEYMMSWLPPGRYYIQVAASSNGSEAEQDRSARPRREDYVRSYYPGTADATAAVPVDVAAGQIVTGVNVTVVKTRVTTVSGRVVNQTGVAARTIKLKLTATFAGLFGAYATANSQGDFEFRGVPAGSYWLDVQMYSQLPQTRYARQEVTVAEEPVNTTVFLPGPYEVPGTVRVEPNAKLDLKSIKIGLRTPWRNVFGFTVTPAAPDGSGAFRLTDVNPERYVLAVENLPEGFYVKSARFGDQNALEKGVDLTRGGAPPIEIVLSGAAASAAGTVKDANGAPVAEAIVSLVPQDAARRSQPMFYSSVKTDASGAFKMTGLIPGEYRLYAFTRVEGEPWVSAGFLRPYEGKSKAVMLREGEGQTAQLEAIPAEPQQ
jgi:beta-lactamase regulating signal transducer with metallopeptidase domain